MVMLLTATTLCVICGIAAQDTDQAFNLALRGRSTQSSTYSHETAAINAIDGNTDSNLNHGSCSCTNAKSPPWWRVDLLRSYKISEIIITNRGDCCPERLNGASVLVGNSLENNGNSNPRCGVVNSANNAGTIRFQCDGMVGRYVNVVIPDRGEYLQICEVQVFGVPLFNDCLM